MSKSKILLIKHPYKGLGRDISDIITTHRKNIEVLSLNYLGDIPFPQSLYRKPLPRYSYQKYNPDHLYLSRSTNDASKEVTLRRLNDIIHWLPFTKYKFMPSINGLTLITDEHFRSTESQNMHRDAIEKVASLIYTEIDGILPLTKSESNDARFMESKETMYRFFQAITKSKPGLFVSEKDFTVEKPVEIISLYLNSLK